MPDILLACFTNQRGRKKSVKFIHNGLGTGDIARKVMSYGTTARNFDGNEMYITHAISSTDTLQGIALKYGVTMEHIRRVNRLWASDSMHLRKTLLIPISVPLLGSPSQTRSFDSNGFQRPPSRSFTPDSNYPLGSRENPLNRAEAMQMLRTLEQEGRESNNSQGGSPESSTSSSLEATTSSNAPMAPSISAQDYLSQLDQKIASCRKQTEITVSNWSSRSFSVEQSDGSSSTKSSVSNGSSSPRSSVPRSPSWGHLVRARKPNPDLQLEGVDNMVFEL